MNAWPTVDRNVRRWPLLLMLCGAAAHVAPGAAMAGDIGRGQEQGPARVPRSDAPVYSLDLANRSVTQPVKPGSTDRAKFVQVEVSKVGNPKKVPLSFEVHYQARDGAKSYLGSFGLYPADNPGRFIVATQGKVRAGGAIVVTLVPLEKPDPADVVNVEIKRIRLVNEFNE